MLLKTHLVIGIAVALYFLPFVNNEAYFIPLVIIASLAPNLESGFSSIKRGFFKISKDKRGILHTYTLCIFISVIFALFFPSAALPVFLGYSFHLLADSFTKQGIQPFWPLKPVSAGVVSTGGSIDKSLFVTFIIIDLILLITLLFS